MDRKTFESYGDIQKNAQAQMKDIASKHDWKTVAMWKHGTVMAIFRCREQLNITLLEAKKMVDDFLASGKAKLTESHDMLDNFVTTK